MKTKKTYRKCKKNECKKRESEKNEIKKQSSNVKSTFSHHEQKNQQSERTHNQEPVYTAWCVAQFKNQKENVVYFPTNANISCSLYYLSWFLVLCLLYCNHFFNAFSSPYSFQNRFCSIFGCCCCCLCPLYILYCIFLASI